MNRKFRHSCVTIFHCDYCKKQFKCKRENSKKEKLKREEEYKKTKMIPLCKLCDKNHWRCNSSKCDQCCKLNRYNKDYALKKYYRYKEHKNCRCDYIDINNICELCNINCIRNLAILPGIIYDVGPWEFGDYRYLDAYDKEDNEEINEIKLNDLKKMKHIQENNISYDDVIKN